MILLKEDFDKLHTAIALLQAVIKNAVLSEIEEANERKFNRAIEKLKLSDSKGIFKFTKKELNKMPNDIKEILSREYSRHIRQKKNGVFEIRLSYKGNKYYGCSKSFEVAKRQFLDSIIETTKAQCAAAIAAATPAPEPEQVALAKDCGVYDYGVHFMEVFKKAYVSRAHYNNYLGVLKNHFAPFFEGVKVSELTSTNCQELLNKVISDGKKRLSEDVKTLLRWICEAALSDGLLKINPMRLVKIPKHRRKNGKQIPVEIMRSFLYEPPQDKYRLFMWVMAYAGFRPSEFKSIEIDGNFITVQNAKAKMDDEPTFRRIPLHPALQPYAEEIMRGKNLSTDYLGQLFHRYFPEEYHLYDLRHTFTSRIQECGAIKAWVDYATNHTNGQNTTDRVYTHWSDVFQTSQMDKLEY